VCVLCKNLCLCILYCDIWFVCMLCACIWLCVWCVRVCVYVCMCVRMCACVCMCMLCVYVCMCVNLHVLALAVGVSAILLLREHVTSRSFKLSTVLAIKAAISLAHHPRSLFFFLLLSSPCSSSSSRLSVVFALHPKTLTNVCVGQSHVCECGFSSFFFLQIFCLHVR